MSSPKGGKARRVKSKTRLGPHSTDFKIIWTTHARTNHRQDLGPIGITRDDLEKRLRYPNITKHDKYDYSNDGDERILRWTTIAIDEHETIRIRFVFQVIDEETDNDLATVVLISVFIEAERW